jgi:hypothetical protein
MWRTRLILRPGQKGTRNLQNKFGSRLICVRYKYNDILHKRQKTIELLEDEINWRPKNRRVYLRVGLREIEIRNKVKTAGGIWLSERKLWELPFIKAMELGLKERIVEK